MANPNWKKGFVPWNKNTKGVMPPAWNRGMVGFRKGIRKPRIQHHCVVCHKTMPLTYPSAVRKTCSKACKKTYMKSYVGEKSWNWKPKTRTECPTCKKLFYKRNKFSKNCSKACYTKSMIGKKQSPEVIKKRLYRRPMSGLEILVNTVVQDNNLPYKFVGNGEFFIENINPDFININGQKKAIEVYWKTHKDQFRLGGTEGWMTHRREVFNKYGWDILFIEGTHINKDIIFNLLTRTI